MITSEAVAGDQNAPLFGLRLLSTTELQRALWWRSVRILPLYRDGDPVGTRDISGLTSDVSIDDSWSRPRPPIGLPAVKVPPRQPLPEPWIDAILDWRGYAPQALTATTIFLTIVQKIRQSDLRSVRGLVQISGPPVMTRNQMQLMFLLNTPHRA